MRDHDRKRLVGRARLMLMLALGALVLVGYRAATLQLREYDRFGAMARGGYLRSVEVEAKRGQIVDRNGKVLAASVDVPSIYADPRQVNNPKATARALVKVIGGDRKTLERRLARTNKKFVWLRRRIESPQLAARVTALGLPGVHVRNEPKRFYPNRDVGAHILGFAGADPGSLEGIEHSLNDELVGETRELPVVRDGVGRAVLAGEIDPQRVSVGADVRLTIDLAIQHAAQQALADGVRGAHALAGAAVVLDVASGDVLAAAVEPSFNPNDDAAQVSYDRRRNRAFTDMFEPGSTLKPVVLAAALDAGVVQPDDVLFCENGAYRIGRHTIRDSKPHGWLGLRGIIAFSSNIGAAKIGQALGKPAMFEALQRFGLGERTGIRFPGESAGQLHPARGWSELELATIAFGHGVAVTPLQLAAAYRALAFGGEYVPPRLVDAVVEPGGGAARPIDPTAPPRRVVSAKSARFVAGMMRAVVGSEGTGQQAAIAGYAVAGKTGTAQKIDATTGTYSADRFMASFAGFLPADNPAAVIVVVLDEPSEGGHTGGAVAAPVFARIAAATMQQLGIPADRSQLLVAAPRSAAGASADAGAADAGASADADAGAAAGAAVGADASRMPSLIGLSARQATERFAQLGWDGVLQVEGFGRVVRQEPASGAHRGRASRVRLVLAQR